MSTAQVSRPSHCCLKVMSQVLRGERNDGTSAVRDKVGGVCRNKKNVCVKEDVLLKD